jgi:hypothetical protein
VHSYDDWTSTWPSQCRSSQETSLSCSPDGSHQQQDKRAREWPVTLSFDDEIARRCSAPLQPPAAAASASASVSASATITTSPALSPPPPSEPPSSSRLLQQQQQQDCSHLDNVLHGFDLVQSLLGFEPASSTSVTPVSVSDPVFPAAAAPSLSPSNPSVSPATASLGSFGSGDGSVWTSPLGLPLDFDCLDKFDAGVMAMPLDWPSGEAPLDGATLEGEF